LEKKGSLTDTELCDLLKESHGEIAFGVVNKTLMNLELGGKIHVSTFARKKRRVELLEKTKT